MKKFVLSLIGLVIIFTAILVHSFSMVKMGKEMTSLTDKTKEYVMADNWDSAGKYIEEIERYWKKRNLWTALTIKTDELEQIEISLAQSKKYVKLQDKSKFMGEFIMFSKLVEHIPHQEGFHLEEIL